MPAIRPPRGTSGNEYPYDGGARHAANAGVHIPAPRSSADRASWRPGASAGATLADHLRQAWIRAGKPHMVVVGDEVGYSKATISKVLSGKMAPAWHLVRKLGVVFGVPSEIVAQEWHPLWIAADNFRRGVGGNQPVRPNPQTGGYICDRCGSWVVNTDLHASWHLHIDRPADGPAPARMTDSLEWATLRDAVSRRADS
jgi:hypothetical protein